MKRYQIREGFSFFVTTAGCSATERERLRGSPRPDAIERDRIGDPVDSVAEPTGHTQVLGQMLIDVLGHLEHRDLSLAAKHRSQFVIGIDISPVFAVLKIMTLDVGPDLLGNLGSRHGVAADNRRECGTGHHRFHECRVRLALDSGLLLGRFLPCRGLLLGSLSCRSLLSCRFFRLFLLRGLSSRCFLPGGFLLCGFPGRLPCRGLLLRRFLPRRGLLLRRFFPFCRSFLRGFLLRSCHIEISC